MADDSPARLTTADYAVFGVTLAISAAIGIVFAIKDRNSEEGTEGYLLGGRSMGMIPVALSLSVSFMSAITVLGAPAEVYLYGTMYWWFLLAMFIVVVVTGEIFIPAFYKMKITSTYEYLEKRFDRRVRVLATVTFIVENIFYIGIVIYAPALALNIATGFNLWGAVLSTGIVCMFYTSLGGIRAVIWTDVFQAFVMVIGFLVVTIAGSNELGGFAEVWRICIENHRVDSVHFDTDPRVRHSFWSVVVGGTFLWLGVYAVSQSQVQRYISCKTEKQAKGALYLNWVGLVVIISLSLMNGAIMYAYFRGCDPLTNGKVSAADQLLPYLALQLFEKSPGLSGLVVSCVFSGSLSTVSSGINAMACVTIEDFIKPATSLSEIQYTWISKGLVVVFGILCIAMAIVASQLGGVLEAALSILGLLGGPLLALFTLALIFPFANSVGALVGLVSGVIMAAWVYIGSKIYPPGQEFVRKLDLSTDNCTILMNENFTAIPDVTTMVPTASTPIPAVPAIANLYHISYSYYSCVGFAATLGVGLVTSLLTGGWEQRKEVNPLLLHFLFDHWTLEWLPIEFRNKMRCGVDRSEYKDDVGLKEHSNMLEVHVDTDNNLEKPTSTNSLPNQVQVGNEANDVTEQQWGHPDLEKQYKDNERNLSNKFDFSDEEEITSHL